MTDQSGAVTWRQDYYAFGSDYGAVSTGNTHKFTGHQQDAATGQYYAKARYFTTQLGRWSQPEPLLSGVPTGNFLANPQRLNPYTYCRNNPLKIIDPNGLADIHYINAYYDMEVYGQIGRGLTGDEGDVNTAFKAAIASSKDAVKGTGLTTKELIGHDADIGGIMDAFNDKEAKLIVLLAHSLSKNIPAIQDHFGTEVNFKNLGESGQIHANRNLKLVLISCWGSDYKEDLAAALGISPNNISATKSGVSISKQSTKHIRSFGKNIESETKSLIKYYDMLRDDTFPKP